MRAGLAPLARAAGATIVERDVDADPSLEAAFGERVPVLLLGGVDGRELCHYTLDVGRTRAALGLS